METKSRYEVLKELQDKKMQLVTEKAALKDQVAAKEKEIKMFKRAMEDKSEDLEVFKKSLPDKETTYNILIEQAEAAIKNLSEFGSQKKQ